jgi:hypothetical protein
MTWLLCLACVAVPVTTADANSEYCERLQELRQMPFKSEPVDDPIYNGLIKEGSKAVQCLIERISDTALMPDPRKAPPVPGFAVGDAAVVMLARITKVSVLACLPEEVASKWSDQGMYAYFDYVSSPENRKDLQHCWQRQIKDD